MNKPGSGPRPTVVAVGLGPAGPEHTSPAALEALKSAPAAFLRTSRHPAAPALAGIPGIVSLDDCYERAASFEEVYGTIVEVLRAAALEHGRVAYAVPGSPSVAERTVELLRADEALDLEIVPGLSFCDLAWARLGVDPVEAGVRLVDAERFSVQAAGDPGPLLVGQCWSKAVLSSLKLAVETGPELPVVLLHHLGLADEVVMEVPWSEIDRALEADHLTSLYVPRLDVPVAQELMRFVELVRILRERCPWDRQQTHASLVRHLLEETYEAIEAIELLGDDPAGAPYETVAHVEEELGDLLCQVLFHATLAAEEGLFTLADVARSVHDKLVARHPHVFGDVKAATPDAVIANWERIKQVEKRRTHLFEGVPPAMPALARVAKAERKLSSVGLGWPATGSDAGSLAARLAEVAQDSGSARPGELLLALARLTAHRGEDPEALVRHALDRLASRVGLVEAAAGDAGADLGTLEDGRRLKLWAEAAEAAEGTKGGEGGEGAEAAEGRIEP